MIQLLFITPSESKLYKNLIICNYGRSHIRKAIAAYVKSKKHRQDEKNLMTTIRQVMILPSCEQVDYIMFNGTRQDSGQF
jgi:hypothetical protein